MVGLLGLNKIISMLIMGNYGEFGFWLRGLRDLFWGLDIVMDSLGDLQAGVMAKIQDKAYRNF